MRQIHVRALVSKPKLENRHARNLQPLPQSMNFGRDVSEIFSEERQAAQSSANGLEEIVTGTIDPGTVDSGWVGSRNFPELIEATKMIKPDVVAVARCPSQTLDPPFIARRFQLVPAVQRVAPALASLAEKIWRNTRHHFRIQILLQTEQFAVGPDVGAVVVDKDCYIANDANRAFGTMPAKGPPLLIKGELQRGANSDVVR